MNFEKIIAERPTKTVYKDNGRTIKLFVENYSKSDILNEAVNQARVEETSINVPNLIEVTKFDNRWALVSEYIEGTTLQELMDKNSEKLDEYLELFIDTQLKILNEKSPLLGRLKDKMRRKINEANNIGDNEKYELLQRLEGIMPKNCICHGDYNPSNVIIKDDDEVYIIDWSHVTQGNPELDAARTFLLFSIQGKKDLAEKYLNKFSTKAGIETDTIQRYIPIVAASQMSKGKPEEQEFLAKWIDVVDFE